MPHAPYLWPDHIIGKRESRRIRNEHNATVNAWHDVTTRNRATIDHITDTLAAMPDTTTPEADALRIALGTLLEATT